jgi:anti-sigma B factor antagonist
MGIQMTDFSIRVVANGPQCDLVLSGEVDLQVSEALVRVAHSHLADTGVQCLLIDLNAVTFMDSTGLGALVAIRNAAKEQGKEIVLDNIPERIRQVLVITGLDGVFATYSKNPSASKLGVRQSAPDGSEADAPTDPQLRIVPN